MKKNYFSSVIIHCILCITVLLATGKAYAAPAAITGPGSVCAGSAITLSDVTPAGVWSSSNSVIASVGTGSGIVTGNTAGTAIISYTVAGSSATVIITVNALPTISAGAGTAVCAGTSTALTATGGNTYTWSPPAGLTATTGASVSATPTATTTYTVTGINTTGCQNTATKTVTVNPLPANITGPSLICLGSTIILSDSTPGGTWSSSNSSTASVGSTSGIVTGVATGSVRISYRLSTGCLMRVTVTVNPTVPAIGGSTSVCVGSTITLTNSVPDCLWTSSNSSIATISSSGVVTGASAGTAVITYTACSNFNTKTITVNAVPVVPAISAGSGSLCANGTLALSESTTGGSAIWVSTNTAAATINAASGLVTGVAAGTTAITYNYTLNGCSTFAAAIVTVNPAVTPTITGPTDLCINAATTLTATPAGGTWASSNATIATVSAGGVVTPLSASSCTISYTYTNGFGCTTNTNVLIVIHPVPVVVGISGTNGVCVGSSITLADPTPGGVWSCSNTSLATVDGTGVVSGILAGVVNISYVVTDANGCSRTRTKATTVNPLPEVNVADGGTICSGHTVILTATGAGGYVWSGDFSNGSPFFPPIGTNVYTVIGTDGHHCSDTAVATVIVLPSPILTSTPDTTLCYGSSVTLYASGADSYAWSDSSIVNGTTLMPPIGSDTFMVTGTGTNGCATTNTIIININPLPEVGIADVGRLCAGSFVMLNGTGAATYTWADGIIDSVAFSPATGINTYTVTGTDINGCANTATVTVTVDPMPDAGTIDGPASVHAGSVFTLTNTATGGIWSSDSTGIVLCDPATGLITCMTPGAATISYTVSNDGCGAVAATHIVTVTPGSSTPLSPITVAQVCVGGTGTAVTSSAPGAGWSCSDISVATIGTSSGIITGISAGTTIITFTAHTGAFITAVITVNAAPAPVTGALAVCPGATSALSSTPGGSWTCSNLARATVDATSGIVTGISAGTAIITNTSSTGCKATAILTVNTQPATISGITGMCSGATSALANATGGGSWSSGTVSVATISNGGLVSALSAGTTIISYTTANGCSRTTVVTVSGAPAISGPGSMCIGSATTFTASLTGGTWSSSAPSIAAAGAGTGLVTATSAGTTNITYAQNAYCKTHITVTVGTTPAAIAGAASVCNGATTTFTHTATGGVWSSSNASVAGAEATSGIITGIAPGSANITYALNAGCYRTKSITVGAGLGPVTGATGLCVGATSIYISTLPAIGLKWTSSNTAVATVGSISGVVTGISPGTAEITFTPYTFSIYAGCVATKIVTVDAVPAISPITGPAGVQAGHTITLADATAGGVWSSNNPTRASVSATGLVTGIAVPATIISYSITNGACVYAATKTITVAAARGVQPALPANEQDITIYPNPTNKIFNLYTPLHGILKIYSIEGKEIINCNINKGENVITLPDNLMPGIYICRFTGSDATISILRLEYN